MCRVLNVTRGGYYAWLSRPVSERSRMQMKLIEQIRQVHEHSRFSYGSPRVQEQLMKEGTSVSVNTVAKLMRRAGIKVRPSRAFVPCTTQADPSHQTFANLLDRDFEAKLPNQKWAGDITYIPTQEGWLYLAIVIDLCSRRIVGWATSDRLKTELVSEALARAIFQRRPGKGLLHHSDRGCQYSSEDYQRLLREKKMLCSMSGVGQCWDNAVAESFFGTLKTELVNSMNYPTRKAAHASLFEWIECWYNPKRLHSSLGYLSPEQFEAQIN